MVESTTLLTYETGWQVRLFELMTASQQANDYIMACNYGLAWLDILGIEKMPTKRMAEKSGGQNEMATWQEFFIIILMTGIGTIGQTIKRVRKEYRKDVDIPKYTKPQAVSN